MVAGSFFLFIVLFLTIGLLASLRAQRSQKDYLLAGMSVPAWLTSLSAAATNFSGYMFIGAIGYTYKVGVEAIWLPIGWFVGDLFSSFIVQNKLRDKTEALQTFSYAGLLANWNNTRYTHLRRIAGVLIIVFLSIYAAAQFTAGSKAISVLFDWNYNTGVLLGASIVTLYCLTGGLRASIWTDALQAIVMLLAMLALVAAASSSLGGLGNLLGELKSVSPNYANPFPSEASLGKYSGLLLFVLGWLFSGLGVVGQPHIMVRFMSMDQSKSIGKVRLYYYSWSFVFQILTIFAGLSTRVLLPETSSFDTELALPALAQNILPSVLVGFVLAGLFSATLSTADSQILSCSAALTQDILPGKINSVRMARLGTFAISLLALSIAMHAHPNVFTLVILAWSALASTFAPLLFVYALKGKPSQTLAITMMLTGLATMLAWRFSGLNTIATEPFAGILAGFSVYGVSIFFKYFKKTPT